MRIVGFWRMLRHIRLVPLPLTLLPLRVNKAKYTSTGRQLLSSCRPRFQGYSTCAIIPIRIIIHHVVTVHESALRPHLQFNAGKVLVLRFIDPRPDAPVGAPMSGAPSSASLFWSAFCRTKSQNQKKAIGIAGRQGRPKGLRSGKGGHEDAGKSSETVVRFASSRAVLLRFLLRQAAKVAVPSPP